MTTSTRLTILGVCALVCASGVVIENSSDRIANTAAHSQQFKTFVFGHYHYATGEPQETDLRQIETAILLHNPVKSGYESFDFGTGKIEGESAFVPVFYFSRDARVLALLYTLAPEKQSWRIVSVQRMRFAPKPRLLRDLRV